MKGVPFEDTAARKWMESLVSSDGPMVDLYRHFNPTTTHAFTHWDTLLNARPSNYGTRIDYILCSRGLLDWFSGCEIRSDVFGSDHCPVVATMHDVHPESGARLINAMQRKGDDVPVLCTRKWKEFTKTQQKITSFFSKRARSEETSSIDVKSECSVNVSKKRSLKVNPFKRYAPEKFELTKEELRLIQLSIDGYDINLAESLSVEGAIESALKQKSAPECHHGIVSQEFTVNKAGVNRGKRFYVCSKPVGEGHLDNNHVKSFTGELSDFKCDFFQWL